MDHGDLLVAGGGAGGVKLMTYRQRQLFRQSPVFQQAGAHLGVAETEHPLFRLLEAYLVRMRQHLAVLRRAADIEHQATDGMQQAGQEQAFGVMPMH